MPKHSSFAEQSFYGLLASFAEPTEAPGGGSAVALAAALAAALVERCANASHPQFTDARSRATELRRKLVRLAERDALVLSILADVGRPSQDPHHDDRRGGGLSLIRPSGPPARSCGRGFRTCGVARTPRRRRVPRRGTLRDAAARAAESIFAVNGPFMDPPRPVGRPGSRSSWFERDSRGA